MAIYPLPGKRRSNESFLCFIGIALFLLFVFCFPGKIAEEVGVDYNDITLIQGVENEANDVNPHNDDPPLGELQ